MGLLARLILASTLIGAAACSSAPAIQHTTTGEAAVAAAKAEARAAAAPTSSTDVANPGAPVPVAGAAIPPANDPANTLIIELKTGKVTIRLRPDLAPQHVERVKALAAQGFYNGLTWHRVIPGFMAQTGDPKGDGTGGSQLPDVPAEFTPTSFERGTVGAARADNPNSANSQFFICFKHSPFLNTKYTVWGNVIDGMQHVDQIAPGEPPPVPDKIIKMYVASAAPT